MNRSIQSLLEQAIRNRDEQIHVRDKEIARLRAQVAALVSAGAKILDELNARIDAAPATAKPVFQGIAELHAAIAAAESEAANG